MGSVDHQNALNFGWFDHQQTRCHRSHPQLLPQQLSRFHRAKGHEHHQATAKAKPKRVQGLSKKVEKSSRVSLDVTVHTVPSIWGWR